VKTVTELLLDLVAIPSVSKMSNQAVIDYVVNSLDSQRWRTSFYSYVDSAGTAKTNLVALTGDAANNHAELAFVCHSDTVPFEADWDEAVHPALRDGRIYGRGSCDVKSFLACALAAFGEVDLHSLRKPLALIVTADEEVGCIGAKRLAAQNNISARYTLIGEPTGLRPVRAGKGYALATITVRGREAHSAFPSEGRSAIYDAARVVLSLERLAVELEKEKDSSFDPPFTTLNTGLIQGGTAKNIVPGECSLVVEWRPIPGQDPNLVTDLIRRQLSGFDAGLDVQRTDPAFAPSKTGDLAHLLTSLTGNPPGTISFGSEAAHLRGLSEEIVVFGPGDMTVAHKTGEFVPVEELYQCVEYLKTAIGRLCLGAEHTG
jgi:acetylornithine deacetylase